jgi:hypothetical protein
MRATKGGDYADIVYPSSTGLLLTTSGVSPSSGWVTWGAAVPGLDSLWAAHLRDRCRITPVLAHCAFSTSRACQFALACLARIGA